MEWTTFLTGLAAWFAASAVLGAPAMFYVIIAVVVGVVALAVFVE